MAPAHDVTTWLAAHLTWLGLRLLQWRQHAHHLRLLLLHAHHVILLLHAHWYPCLRRDWRENGLGRVRWYQRRLLVFQLLLSVTVRVATRRHERHSQVLAVHVVGLNEVRWLFAAIACIKHLVVWTNWLDTVSEVDILATGGLNRSILASGGRLIHHRMARDIWARSGVMWLCGSAQKFIDGILPFLTVIV